MVNLKTLLYTLITLMAFLTLPYTITSGEICINISLSLFSKELYLLCLTPEKCFFTSTHVKKKKKKSNILILHIRNLTNPRFQVIILNVFVKHL